MRTADPAKIQRIVDAAAQLFAERDYHEVRMDDIAEKARVAKGTIYLHFKDKDDLYRALALDSLRKLSAAIRQSVANLDEPAAKLLAINRIVIHYFEHRAYTLDLINRLERTQEQDACAAQAFVSVRDDFKNVLESILREFPGAESRTQTEMSVATLALMGINKELLRQLPRPWPADLPEQLTRLFLQGFLAKAI